MLIYFGKTYSYIAAGKFSCWFIAIAILIRVNLTLENNCVEIQTTCNNNHIPDGSAIFRFIHVLSFAHTCWRKAASKSVVTLLLRGAGTSKREIKPRTRALLLFIHTFAKFGHAARIRADYIVNLYHQISICAAMACQTFVINSFVSRIPIII